MRFCSYFVEKIAFYNPKCQSEKGDNSVKYLQNSAKSLTDHLLLGHNLLAKYLDPSSSDSLDILLTRFHRFTRHKSEKGDNSAKYL